MDSSDPFASVPAGLADTLRKRGFSQLTRVQEAVLETDSLDKDLRLSSHTGSGKTVAIGLALAKFMTKGGRPRREKGQATPSYLLIAPTRELAAQIRKELAWLYRPLDHDIVSVTGGTSIFLDLRALEDNPSVVVGTPGRLLDHVKRGSLDLSRVEAVVLDEADEMLDMGFRDELEGILEATPEERRTHMVSATFPKSVMHLASRYQRDPVLVEGQSPKEANEDIEHLQYSVRFSDRLDAIVNLLLAEPGQRTLIFVRTRVATAELATELTSLGFKAFSLSGDMGQRERSSTLDAFRSGKVELLIATDVAARGLDIQDVNRIIHYDIPENPEALTHRSGRTGRAGAKGVSILLVPPNAARKVAFMTQRARIKTTQTPLPSPEDILKAATKGFVENFDEGEIPNHEREALRHLAEELLKGREPTLVIERLLSQLPWAGPCQPRKIQSPRGRTHFKETEVPKASGRPRRSSENFQLFHVTWGAAHGADPRRLMALICRRGGVSSREVGAIRIGESSSTVEIDREHAKDFESAAGRPDPRDRRIRIRPWFDPKDRGAPRNRTEVPRNVRKPFKGKKTGHTPPRKPKRHKS